MRSQFWKQDRWSVKWKSHISLCEAHRLGDTDHVKLRECVYKEGDGEETESEKLRDFWYLLIFS